MREMAVGGGGPVRPDEILTWSAWIQLEGCWLGSGLPTRPGLYRIQRAGRDDLDYIGQTGAGRMTLRARLAMLRGVYGATMPYRDPHTAGPALWALRQHDPQPFLVSVVPLEGPTPWRKGWECVAISLYRQAHGRSPTVNFGRMPYGYRISTGNTAQLVAKALRSRGGPTTEPTTSHLPGISPVGPLTGDVEGADWCGHQWSAWMPVREGVRQLPPEAQGLYRIRDPQRTGLIYIGQGTIRARLAAHLGKVNRPTARQSEWFAGPIESSWVVHTAWYPHQRLELENDLIAAYLLTTGDVPPAQFLG